MKAISPVIATVIIVSVAIALAIAVALWITGVIGGVSRMERLDVTAVYVNKTFDVANKTYYEIDIKITNKGSVDVTIDNVFVNNVPAQYITNNVTGSESAAWSGNTFVKAGQSTVLKLWLRNGDYVSGQVIQILIHTATGGQYPAQITLP